MVNGKPLKISAPIIVKDGQAMASETLANEIFQSGLDQTFQVETVKHPLNTLTTEEIQSVTKIIQADQRAPKALRFSRIRLQEPEKMQFGTVC